MPKYKLADYRYGREEMLALYVKENKVRFGDGAQFPRLVAFSVSCLSVVDTLGPLPHPGP